MQSVNVDESNTRDKKEVPDPDWFLVIYSLSDLLYHIGSMGVHESNNNVFFHYN